MKQSKCQHQHLAIIEAAFCAARDVGAAMQAKSLPVSKGFSWVTIKPARSPLVATLRRLDLGTADSAGNWQVRDPAGLAVQSLPAKIAGAEAFVAVLREHNVNAVAHSLAD